VPDKDTGNQHMFVCNVLIGEYTKGTRDMKVAPPLRPGSKDVFDTLVNNEKDPTIFVALTDAQAYPEYMITFKL
jgi:poly [ADP-ribose] polymerase 10/14/15